MTLSDNMSSSIIFTTDLKLAKEQVDRIVRSSKHTSEPPSPYSSCSPIRFGLTYLAVVLRTKGITSFDTFVFYARKLYEALNIKPSRKLRLVLRKSLAGTKHATIFIHPDGSFEITEEGIRALYSCALMYGSWYSRIVDIANRIANSRGLGKKDGSAGEMYAAVDENSLILEVGLSKDELMKKLKALGVNMKRVTIYKLVPLEIR